MNDYTDYTNCTEPECWHPDGHEYDTDDEFGGVRSCGGTAISVLTTCEHCGLQRTEYSAGSQRNPGEPEESVSYEAPEADHVPPTIAALRELAAALMSEHDESDDRDSVYYCAAELDAETHGDWQNSMTGSDVSMAIFRLRLALDDAGESTEALAPFRAI